MINFEINKRLATDYIQDKKMLSVKKSAITNNVAFHTHDFFEIEIVSISWNNCLQLSVSQS